LTLLADVVAHCEQRNIKVALIGAAAMTVYGATTPACSGNVLSESRHRPLTADRPLQDYSHRMRRALLFLLFAATPVFGESIYVDMKPCADEAPETPYGNPQCADYELHSALIASAETGDRSAIALLRSRYALAETHSERHRIAAALLRFTPDDTTIWRDIYAEAELAVRFANVDHEVQPAFEKWCEERNLDPYEHGPMLDDAFVIAAPDPRSKALLVKALETKDEDILFSAIAGLAEQRDLASLPAIEAAIERFDVDDRQYVAMTLAAFQSERADAIAVKFIENEDDLARYRESR